MLICYKDLSLPGKRVIAYRHLKGAHTVFLLLYYLDFFFFYLTLMLDHLRHDSNLSFKRSSDNLILQLLQKSREDLLEKRCQRHLAVIQETI